MNTLRIEAPSDAQLTYIAGLCEERGLEPPQVVASKAEASEIIARILAREYEPAAYAYDQAWGWTEPKFRDDARRMREESEWHEQRRYDESGLTDA